jgi:HPt (histidine-containing phosphotransfer) domain-containing protein
MGYLQWNNFLMRLDDNRELACELAQDFLSSVEERWEAYDQAMQSLQPKDIEQTAHALRGLLAPYGGEEGLQILKRVEEKARGGHSDAHAEQSNLRHILNGLKSEIQVELGRVRDEGLS